jgi:hypothetical protein
VKTEDWHEPFADDPVAVRLSRIQDPPVSTELMARVLAETPASKTRRIRRRHVLVALAALVVLGTVTAATPVGATVGRAILPKGMQQWFGIVSGAPPVITRPPNACSPSFPPISQISPGTTVWRSCPHGGAFGISRPLVVSVADAQRQVGFPIRAPAWLPPGLTVAGVEVDSGHSISVVCRKPGDDPTLPGLGVYISEHPGGQVGGSAVPSSGVQHVTVGGRPAVYVHGDYEGPPGVGRWTPNADAEELSWARDGVTYDLLTGGLHLSRGDLIRIAESMR